MSTYTIEANGTPMGEYTGETATDALNAYARDAGYADYAAAVEATGGADDATATEIDVDGLVAAVAAATGQAVFQDAYGSGIAVVAGKSFATYQELAESIGRNAWDTFEAPVAAFVIETANGEPVDNGRFDTLEAAKTCIAELSAELGWSGMRVVLDNGPRYNLSGKLLTGADAHEVVFTQGEAS